MCLRQKKVGVLPCLPSKQNSIKGCDFFSQNLFANGCTRNEKHFATVPHIEILCLIKSLSAHTGLCLLGDSTKRCIPKRRHNREYRIQWQL